MSLRSRLLLLALVIATVVGSLVFRPAASKKTEPTTGYHALE